MAGAGYKLFNTGDVLTAAQVNTYLQEQTVMVFANSTARTTALSGVLAEGMVSYLQDTNAVEVYNGSAWVGVSGAGDVTEVQAGTGISVASGTGPIPVVTNTMATEITAKGDLIVGTGSGTFDNLPVGTNGYTLVADSSTATGLAYAAPASPTFIGVAVSNSSSSQSVANNTQTAITWATETFDTDAFHSTATNTSRITIPSGKNGYYQVGAVIETDDNSTGLRELSIYKNGSAVQRTLITPSETQFLNPSIRIDLPMNLAVSDYIEVFYRQTSGNSQTPTTSGTSALFYAYFIGA